MNDIDILSIARVLMTRHGERAKLVAAQRERAMFVKSDFKGVIVWRRVGAAIEELERVEPREDEAVK